MTDKPGLVESLVSKVWNLDGWRNLLSGMGTTLDKTSYTQFARATEFTEEELSSLFEENDLAQKIVGKVPREAMRLPYEIKHPDAATLRKDAEALEVDCHVLEGWIWGRLHGGNILILGADEGLNLADPLTDESTIARFEWMRSVPRWNCTPRDLVRSPISPRFTLPEIYPVNYHGWSQDVHHSRVIRFDGAYTPPTKRLQNMGWTTSVLRAPYDVLSQFGVTWAGMATLMQEAVVGEFKVKNLIAALASGGTAEDTVLRRMQLVSSSKSIAKSVVLDADTESWRRDSIAFTGVAEILNLTMYRMASAAEMPVTVLFGRAPAGMNATGESDMRQWYDSIRDLQTKVLGPALTRIYNLLARKNGKQPDVEIVFPPLWQETRQEEVQAKKIQAEIDTLYFNMGALLPEQIARARFAGPDGYSFDLQLQDSDIYSPDTEGKDLGDGDTGRVTMTPTDQKIFVRVAEARKAHGLAPLGTEDDRLFVIELEAKKQAYGETVGSEEAKDDTGASDPVTAPPGQGPNPFPAPSPGAKGSPPPDAGVPDPGKKPIPPDQGGDS